MNSIDLSTYKLDEADGVFTYKNENTTLGFVRFNEKGEVEYIFVNPIFRKKGIATKLLQLVKQKTGKEIILQEPISPLGSKLLNGNKFIIFLHSCASNNFIRYCKIRFGWIDDINIYSINDHRNAFEPSTRNNFTNFNIFRFYCSL